MAGVQRALVHGADPNQKAFNRKDGTMGGKCTAVLVAAYNGNVRELRFLLAATARLTAPRSPS